MSGSATARRFVPEKLAGLEGLEGATILVQHKFFVVPAHPQAVFDDYEECITYLPSMRGRR